MKFSIFTLLPIASASISVPFLDKFENWVQEFRIRITDEPHLYDVIQKWIINNRYIDAVNKAGRGYILGHNQFSGMDEFDFINYVMQNNKLFNHFDDDLDTTLREHSPNITYNNPPSINWINAGAVTPIKDQGQCGSCWSFSATGALEGIYKIMTGKLVDFSQQHLVDCDNLKNGGRDHGCKGGLMENAFTWISKNGGLCSEEAYPYVSGDGTTQVCQKSCSVIPKSNVASYVSVEPTDNALMYALSQQPVAIAIEADQRDFQLYKSGVFTGTCGTNLDHGVLAVGYGSEEGADYYLVKNSWGTTWGDNGYIKLARGPQYNNGKGQCGILLEATYPVL